MRLLQLHPSKREEMAMVTVTVIGMGTGMATRMMMGVAIGMMTAMAMVMAIGMAMTRQNQNSQKCCRHKIHG
jgi:hypothetical protein